MNTAEIKELICSQEWTLQIVLPTSWTMTVTMGQHGVITVIFNPDGSISYPSNMAFLPTDLSRWEFDEEAQKIKFFNPEGDVTNIYGLPEKIGDSRIVIYSDKMDGDNRTRIISYPSLLGGLHKRHSPNIPLSSGNMVITNRYIKPSPLREVADANALRVHRLSSASETIMGLRETFNYLVEHPDLETIALIDGDQIDYNPFNLAEDNKVIVKTSEFALIGKRALMIEMLGKVLIELNHEAFDKKLMDDEHYQTTLGDVLNKYFEERIKVIY